MTNRNLISFSDYISIVNNFQVAFFLCFKLYLILIRLFSVYDFGIVNLYLFSVSKLKQIETKFLRVHRATFAYVLVCIYISKIPQFFLRKPHLQKHLFLTTYISLELATVTDVCNVVSNVCHSIVQTSVNLMFFNRKISVNIWRI